MSKLLASLAMRIIRRIFTGIGIAFILLFLYGETVGPMIWKWMARRESIALLSGGKTKSELQEAVIQSGAMIPIRDGSWIAIRYCDNHSGWVSSIAIARDSGGSLFESSVHFCGAFGAYRHLRQEMENDQSDAADIIRSVPVYTALDAIHSAESLEEGRKHLLELGFEPLK